MMRHIFQRCFIVFLTPYLAFAQPLKVDVSATSAILINADTGKVLYEKNAHKSSFPASTTKIATAFFALTKKPGPLDQLVRASPDVLASVAPQIRRTKHPSYRLEHGGTHMGIKVGEEIPYRDLLYGLMLISANDAANAIAEHVSGNVPAFVEELNCFLKEQGCLKTVFSNPHGLHADDHLTTAYDLAHMARLAMQNPLFREIVKTPRFHKAATNKQEGTTFVQSNALLKQGPHFNPKAIGIKTGYTLSAGQNLVAAAKDERRNLIAVVLGCKDFHQRFKDANALFEAAFQEQEICRTLFAKGFDPFTMKVEGGDRPLQAVLAEDLILNYFPSEEPKFKAVLCWHEMDLPIQEKQLVGEIQLVGENGTVIKKAPIFALEKIEKTLLHQFLLLLREIKIFLARRFPCSF